MVPHVTIAGRRISGADRPYIVAELSANHAGSLDHALAVIDAAKKSGADAIKLQTYTADTITIDHDGPGFVIEGGLWDGRQLYELYDEAHTPWDWHPKLFERARSLSLTIFSTPFDDSAVDFLEKLEVPAYKIASFEIVDLPLIRTVARTGKPTIISTGMSSEDEIGEAVEAFRSAGGTDLVLLHCVSAYPAPAGEANLMRIARLGSLFGFPIGLSDHTLGIDVAVAATGLGACLIEKHFTLRRADGGPDSVFSIEPSELRALVSGTKIAHEALGSGSAERSAAELGNKAFRRSIYVTENVAAGETLTKRNTRIIRPGFGLAPKFFEKVIGQRAVHDIPRGTALRWDLISL